MIEDERPTGTEGARRRPGRALAAVLSVILVAAASFVLGGLTSLGQTVLPEALVSLANSAGAWTALTAALVVVSRRGPILGAALGPVAFVALVEGYRLVSNLRGYEFGAPFTGMWIPIGLVTGPIIGWAAATAMRGRNPWRSLATIPIVGVLVGESVFGLVVISGSTSPVYWTIQGLVGIAFLVLVLVRARPRPALLALTLGGCVLAAGAFAAGYSLLGSV